MTKAEMMKKIESLKEKNGISRIDGICWNSNKAELQNAIDCLECDGETLDDYITVIKLVYPNTYHKIINNGDWKKHPFNRLYVYNTARLALHP